MVGLGRGSTVAGKASLRRRASTMTWTRPDFEHISQQVGVPRQLDGRLADEAERRTDEQRSEHSRHGRRRHLVDVASPRHALQMVQHERQRRLKTHRVECYYNRTITRFSIQTAGLAFGGTGLCSYRVRGVGGSCAEHLTVESYTIIISIQSYLLSYLLLLVFHHPLTLSH